MNELTQLLQQLAEKLGTTTEYLWSVLIQQAPISAATTLLQIIIIVIAGFFLYKLHRKFSKKSEAGRSMYWDHEEALEAPMIIAAIIWVIFCIILFFHINNMITGFLNPEYWALKEILDTIK